MPAFYDDMLNVSFGRAGQDLIPKSQLSSGVTVFPVLPMPDIDRMDGGTPPRRRYQLLDSTKPELGLTAPSEMRYYADIAAYEQAVSKHLSHRQCLLSYLLTRCSLPSHSAMGTYDTFSGDKASFDTCAIWDLICKVHLYSSPKMRIRHLREFTSLSQSGSFDVFLVELRRRFALFMGAFESSVHRGFISGDDLLRAIFLSGLDTSFERILERVHAEKPDASSQQTMEFVQSALLERHSGGPSSFVPARGLLAVPEETLAPASVALVAPTAASKPRP